MEPHPYGFVPRPCAVALPRSFDIILRNCQGSLGSSVVELGPQAARSAGRLTEGRGYVLEDQTA